MKRKIKILKYIANFFAFSALSLSTIIPLTYQQKTILKQNFNVLNRDFDENYNKKIANFSDFLELKSVQEDGQNLIIESKLKKSFSLIQQTSTNLKINNDQYFNLIVKPNGEVLVNSKELKIFNEIGKIYLKNKTPHLVFRGYDLDFDALVKYKKIEKTFFFAIPAIVWAIGGAIIAATGTYALHEVGKSIADSIPADNVFGGLGSWGQSVGYIEKIEADDVFKKDQPIKKDEAIAAAKTITFEVVSDEEQLKKFDGIHLAYLSDLTGSVIISSQEINFYLAWIFAVNYRLFADIFLSKITDLGVYSSLNKSLPEKFGKYVDFYSQSRDQMFELATATATTLNTILGFSQITNGYLNDDGDFGKEWYSIKENSLTDIIPPLPSGKEEISISLDENKNKVIEIEGKTINKKGHPKNVMFDYFHVRREMMIFGENRGTNKKILQQKLNLRKSYERTHFLYGNPKAIGGKYVGKN